MELSFLQQLNKYLLLWGLPGLLIICLMALLVTRYKQTADIPLKLIFFSVLLLGYS